MAFFPEEDRKRFWSASEQILMAHADWLQIPSSAAESNSVFNTMSCLALTMESRA